MIIYKQKYREIASVHVMKEYVEVEVQLHSFLACAPDGGHVHTSTDWPLGEGYISTHGIRDWLGPGVGLGPFQGFLVLGRLASSLVTTPTALPRLPVACSII